MKVVRYVSAFICLALGVGFAVGTVSALRQTYGGVEPWIPAMCAAIFLLGAYLLLRQRPTKDVRMVDPVPTLAPTKNDDSADRLRASIDSFLKIISYDSNPKEVQASGYAVASAVGFFIGFAAAKIGTPIEAYLEWCRDGFEKAARDSYKAHVR